MNSAQMTEKKKTVLESVTKNIDYMSEFDLGVLIGTAEANRKRREGEKHEEHAANM